MLTLYIIFYTTLFLLQLTVAGVLGHRGLLVVCLVEMVHVSEIVNVTVHHQN